MQITSEELLLIIGAKEAELFLYRKAAADAAAVPSAATDVPVVPSEEKRR